MPADRGYAEAVRLLQDKYGNELKIAAALMEKACGHRLRLKM